MNIDLIKQMIREEIIKHEHDRLIFEYYAYERSDFQDKIEQRVPIIFLHYCLIQYYRLMGCDNLYENHWKSELFAQLAYLTRLKIKKNNSIDYRKKTIKQIWNNAEFSSDLKSLAYSFIMKFNEENVDVESLQFEDVLNKWQNDCNNIINIIASNNVMTAKEYIDKL